MERALERDKKSRNESEPDLGEETQTSRAAHKSPIHESITQSKKDTTSGEMNDTSGEKVESSTSMGDTRDVSNLSRKSAKREQSGDGETHETTRTKLLVSTKASRSDDSPDSEKNETSSLDSQSDHANEETSKTDKRSLRKGKWAVGGQPPVEDVEYVRS